MTPLKNSKNLAARMGRWSSSHWKTAVFGWLAFVLIAFAVGMQLGTTYIDQNDSNVGESRAADRIIDGAGFKQNADGERSDQQVELVLFQSKKLTVASPAFQAAIRDAQKTLGKFPQVTDVKSPLAAEHKAD